jgi:hypothetical protein
MDQQACSCILRTQRVIVSHPSLAGLSRLYFTSTRQFLPGYSRFAPPGLQESLPGLVFSYLPRGMEARSWSTTVRCLRSSLARRLRERKESGPNLKVFA